MERFLKTGETERRLGAAEASLTMWSDAFPPWGEESKQLLNKHSVSTCQMKRMECMPGETGKCATSPLALPDPGPWRAQMLLGAATALFFIYTRGINVCLHHTHTVMSTAALLTGAKDRNRMYPSTVERSNKGQSIHILK